MRLVGLVLGLSGFGVFAALPSFMETDLIERAPREQGTGNALETLTSAYASSSEGGDGVEKVPDPQPSAEEIFEEMKNTQAASTSDEDLDCCERCYVYCWEPWWLQRKGGVEGCCRFLSCGMAQDEPCGLCTVCNPEYRRRRGVKKPNETLKKDGERESSV